MPNLLIATTNQGKKREIEAYLSELPLEIFSLLKLNLNKTYPEKGKTFQENARGKSLFYSQYWEGITIAEDSGLEIDHLDGAPGVYSARFSGPQATDEQNNNKVLYLMEGVPYKDRRAHFISCMVLSQKGQILTEIMGCSEGIISLEPKGQSGFGYDPIFYYPPLKKTFAQMKSEEKNRVSHRGKAMAELRSEFDKVLIWLRQWLAEEPF